MTLLWLTDLIGGKVTEMQSIIGGHSLDQDCMEELTKLRHQAVPLVFLCIVAEEAVQ